MKRVVVAALLMAAGGLITFNAPARAFTEYSATMVGTTSFTYQKGVCGNSSGNGDFALQTGDKIKWTNCTQAVHTVTAVQPAGAFDSGDVAPNDNVTISFTTPGTFTYQCKYHPSTMHGTITVTGEAPGTTQTTPTTEATTTTTAKKATTTTSSSTTTSTTDNLNGVFDETPTSADPTTTIFTTDTTRALGTGGDSGTSAGVVAALIVGLGAVGTAVALLVRRMRAGAPPAPPL